MFVLFPLTESMFSFVVLIQSSGCLSLFLRCLVLASLLRLFLLLFAAPPPVVLLSLSLFLVFREG